MFASSATQQGFKSQKRGAPGSNFMNKSLLLSTAALEYAMNNSICSAAFTSWPFPPTKHENNFAFLWHQGTKIAAQFHLKSQRRNRRAQSINAWITIKKTAIYYSTVIWGTHPIRHHKQTVRYFCFPNLPNHYLDTFILLYLLFSARQCDSQCPCLVFSPHEYPLTW